MVDRDLDVRKMAMILDDLRAATPIVHEYDEIDPRRVYEGLVAAVRDIPEYLRHVHDYVQGLPPTQTT